VKAIAVVPGSPSTAGVVEIPEPSPAEGSVLVRTRLVGICGTDVEIARDGGVAELPPGEERLVLGHESLGEVLEAPPGSGLDPGDLVVGIVRRPDPLPCPACAVDEWDMCGNGGFVERGIKGLHGYGSERFRVDPRFAVRLDPTLGDLGVLLEPTTVVAKAWEHVGQIGLRAWFDPKVALITGAGPIGLLAALLARQRGLDTYVVDLATDGVKPQLVADLGAHYHSGPVDELPVAPDVVIECTGVGQLAASAALGAAPGAIICLTGLAHTGGVVESRTGELNNALVFGNKVAFGTVNAARRHYQQAAEALSRADPDWLARLITRRVAPAEWATALDKGQDDIKIVVDMTATGPA
jgi:threonine dehydrogenase-like Zn-dependent dehydrogenase